MNNTSCGGAASISGSSSGGSASPAAAAAAVPNAEFPPAHEGSGATGEALGSMRGSLELSEGLPPGDAAELAPAAAAAERVWHEYNAPAAKRRRLRRSPYFRRGVQCAAGTAAILAVISVPAVYDALSLDPVMGSVFILVFYFIVLLVALSSGIAPLQVAAEQLVGSALGVGLGLAGEGPCGLLLRAAWHVQHVACSEQSAKTCTAACLSSGPPNNPSLSLFAVIYLIFAINGCSYHDTALKGVLMALLSGVRGTSRHGQQECGKAPVPATAWVPQLPLGSMPCSLPYLGFPTPPPAAPPPLAGSLLPCAAVVMFVLTAVRFTYAAYATFHSSAGLTFAISTAVSYHTRDQMWKCVGATALLRGGGWQWSGIWVGVCRGVRFAGKG